MQPSRGASCRGEQEGEAGAPPSQPDQEAKSQPDTPGVPWVRSLRLVSHSSPVRKPGFSVSHSDETELTEHVWLTC